MEQLGKVFALTHVVEVLLWSKVSGCFQSRVCLSQLFVVTLHLLERVRALVSLFLERQVLSLEVVDLPAEIYELIELGLSSCFH